jgi:hypothetical protein
MWKMALVILLSWLSAGLAGPLTVNRWSKCLCASDVTSNVQSVPRLSQYLAQSDGLAADRQGQEGTRLTLTPSVITNSNYVITVSDWNCLKYFCVFLYCNHQVHRDFLMTLYNKYRLLHKFILPPDGLLIWSRWHYNCSCTDIFDLFTLAWWWYHWWVETCSLCDII